MDENIQKNTNTLEREDERDKNLKKQKWKCDKVKRMARAEHKHWNETSSELSQKGEI